MSTVVEAIDGPLLKVPFESLKRTTRDRKYILEELDSAVATIQTATSSRPDVSKEDAVQAIDEFIDRLQGIKRKLDVLGGPEAADAQRCKARLEHLVQLGAPVQGHHVEWNRRRLDRLLVDYLLRAEYFESAQHLTRAAGIQDLVDLHVFEDVRPVLEALRQHDCGPALAWCADNRARLRKLKSKLEFRLRVQEFIELVRAGHPMQAIAYSRQHLAPWAASYMQELQRTMAVLAFRPLGGGSSNGSTPPMPSAAASPPASAAAAPVAGDGPLATTSSDGGGGGRVSGGGGPGGQQQYADLYSPTAWEDLQRLVLQELYRLNSMTPRPLLDVHLQAGLSALKTPPSGSPQEEGEGEGRGARVGQLTTNREDPLGWPDFRRLSVGLPYAKHVHSKLLCAVTRTVMNEHNPPMVLPNGSVYSEAAIQRVAATHGGRFVDPRSGEAFELSEIRRAYIS